MKTKEKIERAGFVYKTMFGQLEVYVKGGIGILYDKVRDEAMGYYELGNTQIKVLDDLQFELLLDNVSDES